MRWFESSSEYHGQVAQWEERWSEKPEAVGSKPALTTIHKLKKNVLLPFGGGLRYDLAFDEDGILHRVQCKTGCLRNGVIRFNACSSQRDTKVTTSYRGSADYFGVHCWENGMTCLVPVDRVDSVTQSYLRVDPTKNGQSARILWAKDFLI